MFSPEASTWKGRLRVPLLDRIHCPGFPDGADDGVRTRGLLLGKQACCHCTTSAWPGLLNGVEPYPLRPERGGVLFHTWEPRLRCEGWDSNPRPPGYEPGELPSCSTPHGRAFFRIRRTAVTYSPPAERGMAGLRVGLTGFEPATPCSQSTCATKLRHNPIFLTGLRGLPATYVPY